MERSRKGQKINSEEEAFKWLRTERDNRLVGLARGKRNLDNADRKGGVSRGVIRGMMTLAKGLRIEGENNRARERRR